MPIYDAYISTRLLFKEESRRVDIRTLQDTVPLPDVCYMVSAENPMDQVLPPEINEARSRELLEQSLRDGVFLAEGWGELEEYREKMVLVRDRDRALTYARQYGQRAIFMLDIPGDELMVVVTESDEIVRRRVLGIR